MDKKKLHEYYIEKDYNCAEAVLRAANEEYRLGLDETAYHLVGGFGGGMGCGSSCGALCSSIAVIGRLLIEERAHATEGFKDKCADFCRRFTETLGSTECSILKETYMEGPNRCLKTVELAYGLLEDFLVSEGKLAKKAQDGKAAR